MPKPGPPYLLDVPAIRAWAEAGSNEAQAILGAIQNETIHVYNRVWKHAKDAYPDECTSLSSHTFTKKRCNEEHRSAAAECADGLNATFPLKGSYDDAIEWMVVGIATAEALTIVTDDRRKQKYLQIDGLTAITYEELLDEI
jgi:hypothetical protein